MLHTGPSSGNHTTTKTGNYESEVDGVNEKLLQTHPVMFILIMQQYFAEVHFFRLDSEDLHTTSLKTRSYSKLYQLYNDKMMMFFQLTDNQSFHCRFFTPHQRCWHVTSTNIAICSLAKLLQWLFNLICEGISQFVTQYLPLPH